MNWKDYIGKRVLVCDSPLGDDDPNEARVLEVSPSGKRVKFQWLSGACAWETPDEIRLVEVLEDSPPGTAR